MKHRSALKAKLLLKTCHTMRLILAAKNCLETWGASKNYCINKVRKKRNSLSPCRPLLMIKKAATKSKKTPSSTDQAPRSNLERQVESTALVKNDRIGVRWRGQKVLRKRAQMGAAIRKTEMSTTITVQWGTALSLKTCLLPARVTMTSVPCLLA